MRCSRRRYRPPTRSSCSARLPPKSGRFPSARCRSRSEGWTRRSRAIRSRRAGRWGWRKPESRSHGAGDCEGHLFSSVRLRRRASDRPGRGRAPHPGRRRAADGEAATPGARRHVEELLATLGDAALRPHIADFVEDYSIFEIEAFAAPCAAAALWTDHAHTVAQVLRAEPHTLSQQEVADATASRLSFGPDDATFIDKDATLLFDP